VRPPSTTVAPVAPVAPDNYIVSYYTTHETVDCRHPPTAVNDSSFGSRDMRAEAFLPAFLGALCFSRFPNDDAEDDAEQASSRKAMQAVLENEYGISITPPKLAAGLNLYHTLINPDTLKGVNAHAIAKIIFCELAATITLRKNVRAKTKKTSPAVPAVGVPWSVLPSANTHQAMKSHNTHQATKSHNPAVARSAQLNGTNENSTIVTFAAANVDFSAVEGADIRKLPEEFHEKLFRKLKHEITCWTKEAQSKGICLHYWNVMTDEQIMRVAVCAPMTQQELSATEIFEKTFLLYYGLQLVVTILEFIKAEEGLEDRLNRLPIMRPRKSDAMRDSPVEVAPEKSGVPKEVPMEAPKVAAEKPMAPKVVKKAAEAEEAPKVAAKKQMATATATATVELVAMDEATVMAKVMAKETAKTALVIAAKAASNAASLAAGMNPNDPALREKAKELYTYWWDLETAGITLLPPLQQPSLKASPTATTTACVSGVKTNSIAKLITELSSDEDDDKLLAPVFSEHSALSGGNYSKEYERPAKQPRTQSDVDAGTKSETSRQTTTTGPSTRKSARIYKKGKTKHTPETITIDDDSESEVALVRLCIAFCVCVSLACCVHAID
jgi:hypothetical protein